MKIFAFISNCCAWLLLKLGVGFAVGGPIAVPVYAKMQSISLSWTEVLSLSAIGLCMAAGSLLVLKRRLLGVWLSLIPGVAWIVAGQVLAGLVYLVAALLVLCPPVLVYRAISQEKSVDPRVA